jgi:1,4-dihydroxy-2-naphthoyl-CoA hydrolase
MFRDVSIEELNQFSKNTLIEHLSINFKEIGDDYIIATMPVGPKVHQPIGYLHGGASLALAETVGSVASHLLIDPKQFNVFGLEINANHIRSVKDGLVIATAKPIHLGNKTHVWDIRIEDDKKQLVCIVRLTNMVVKKRSE